MNRLIAMAGFGALLTYSASSIYAWHAVNKGNYGLALFLVLNCLIMLVCFTNAIWRRE